VIHIYISSPGTGHRFTAFRAAGRETNSVSIDDKKGRPEISTSHSASTPVIGRTVTTKSGVEGLLSVTFERPAATRWKKSDDKNADTYVANTHTYTPAYLTFNVESFREKIKY